MVTFVLVIVAGIVAASVLALIYWGALVLIRPFLDRFRRSVKPRGTIFMLSPPTLMSRRGGTTFPVFALSESHATGNICVFSRPEKLLNGGTFCQIG